MALTSSLNSAGSLLGGILVWLASDSRIVVAFAVVLLPLLLTYTLTALKSNWARNVRGKGAPPPVPYPVPLLGNTFQFAYDTEGFLSRTL